MAHIIGLVGLVQVKGGAGRSTACLGGTTAALAQRSVSGARRIGKLFVAAVTLIGVLVSNVTAQQMAPITAIVTIQATEGMTESDLSVEGLKNLEQWLVQTTLERARANYAKQGFDPKTFKPKLNVGSVYTQAGGKKLGVIKLNMDNQIRTVWVLGFNRKEFLRVTCIRGSNHDIPVFSGECGNKVTEAFGVSLKPQLAPQ